MVVSILDASKALESCRGRRRLVGALHTDLIGPFVPPDHAAGGEEVLPLAPSRWYLTGFLAPESGRAPDVDDTESQEGGLASDPGIADETHADRTVADLIYFPTGGGKTEAYLGLIAFTLLLRRLRGKSRPDDPALAFFRKKP